MPNVIDVDLLADPAEWFRDENPAKLLAVFRVRRESKGRYTVDCYDFEQATKDHLPHKPAVRGAATADQLRLIAKACLRMAGDPLWRSIKVERNDWIFDERPRNVHPPKQRIPLTASGASDMVQEVKT